LDGLGVQVYQGVGSGVQRCVHVHASVTGSFVALPVFNPGYGWVANRNNIMEALETLFSARYSHRARYSENSRYS